MPTQMNIRIESDLKTAGDAALADAGYTPTTAVRTLWAFAARNAHDPAAVRTAIAFLSEGEDDAEQQRRARAVEEGPRIVERFMQERGLRYRPDAPRPSDKELLEQAIAEAYREKGLL